MSDFRNPVATSISVHVHNAAAISADVEEDSYVSIDVGEYPTKVVLFLDSVDQAQALVAAATAAAEALSAREAVSV